MKKNLVIVDCQFDFYHHNGTLYVPGAPEAVINIRRHLQEHARDYRTIFVTQDWHPADHCSFKEQGGPWPSHCVADTDGSKIYEGIEIDVEKLYAEQVITTLAYITKGTQHDKEEYGAFEGWTDEDFDEYTKSDEFVVVGIAGDFCVSETIKCLLKAGKKVTVIKDCIASINQETFNKFLRDNAITEELFSSRVTPDEWMSVFDTDLYKFTTSYAYMAKYPHAVGTFSFHDRNNTEFNEDMLQVVKRRIYKKFKNCIYDDVPDEWLASAIPFIPQYYWEWLKGSFRFNPDLCKLYLDENNHLKIDVTDTLCKATLYEIPVLYIVSEYLGERNKEEFNHEYMVNRLQEKITLIKNSETQIKFSEFGTRRRYSFDVQDYVVKTLAANLSSDNFAGTSNVLLAYRYKQKPMGTHPHEWFMFHGAQFGIKHANYLALEAWNDVYRGDLGIALTDTYTTDLFFENLTKMQAKLLDGLRQDSGDEYEFVDKAIKRYNVLRVPPLTKTIVFSNALNFTKAIKIAEYCKDKIQCSFGIGTNLTNDVGMKKKPNIVMKLIKCAMNNKSGHMPCIKISDDEGKHMGDPEEIQTAMRIIKSVKGGLQK